jgi:hypothetical protein
VTVVVLMVASAWALQSSLRAEQAVNRRPMKNREEQSNMTNETVIMLIEARIQPQRRTELVEAARQYLPLVRAEPGVQAFYITARKDIPIHLFSTRSTGRKQRWISICSRTSLRNSWQR